jgi:2-C-methyl-D-erythritol 4-phosphate cytidylyltransferase/2-C-methyl-D-erythritol 2,4-cyclodiphosphate synthase
MADRVLHLILLAGGQGLRAGSGDPTPKQFRPTGRGLLFTVSLREFLKLDGTSGHRPADVVVTVSDPWYETAAEALADCDIPWGLAPAGASRTASTWNAVRQMAAEFAPRADDLVAVHDAARPFASVDLLARLCEAAAESGGAVPGVAVPDTIVQSTSGGAVYLERSALVAVQTPQVFRWGLFETAHGWADGQGCEFTDDGGLMASRGHPPVVVPGEQDNWKVTTANDWGRAVSILGES